MNLERTSQPDDHEGNAERTENIRGAFQIARESIDPEIAERIFPEDVRVTSLEKRYFQSKTFERAGYSYMPERYGTFDRTLTLIGMEDDSKVFIMSGKVSSDNPYEVFHATVGGVDLRGSEVVIYAYDGDETITEFTNGQVATYTGENGGDPEKLLEAIHENLGSLMVTETF